MDFTARHSAAKPQAKIFDRKERKKRKKERLLTREEPPGIE
jgi:hypothetical protein